MEYDKIIYDFWENYRGSYKLASNLTEDEKEAIIYLCSNGSCENVEWNLIERLVYPEWEPPIYETTGTALDMSGDTLELELYGLQNALIEQGYIKCL